MGPGQDVLDARPPMVAEVVAGTLHIRPGPGKRHAWASSVKGIEIGTPFGRGRGGPGGWLIIDEPELHVGEDIVVPDLAGWRRETMSEDMDGAYFTQAPDWVCEVVSPSTRRLDRGEMRSAYACEKVPHHWFVDPDARTQEAFELRGELRVLPATLIDDAPVSLPSFEAISIPLDAFWPEVTATVVKEGENTWQLPMSRPCTFPETLHSCWSRLRFVSVIDCQRLRSPLSDPAGPGTTSWRSARSH